MAKGVRGVKMKKEIHEGTVILTNENNQIAGYKISEITESILTKLDELRKMAQEGGRTIVPCEDTGEWFESFTVDSTGYRGYDDYVESSVEISASYMYTLSEDQVSREKINAIKEQRRQVEYAETNLKNAYKTLKELVDG